MSSNEEQTPINIGSLMGWSVFTGFSLAIFVVLSAWAMPVFSKTTQWFILFCIVAYIMPFLSTLIAQTIRCKGSIDAGHAAVGSVYTLGYILVAYAITNAEFIRSLVESCMYGDDQKTVKSLEAEYPMARYFTLAYYVFFGAVIGQIQGGGMAIKC